MAKKQKNTRPKARLPRGFVDRSADDIRATDKMIAAIRQVFELYGFDPLETPAFEYTDALGKYLPDADRPNAGVFSLTDDDDQWMSLRYDLTAPLARHVAQNINDIQLPHRTYRAGYVFRNEKPGPGRFRQFMQFDADTIGAPNVSADAEMCMMMADTMEQLGIERGDYIVRVNNRKVLEGVLEAAGLAGDDHAGTRLSVLRSIDKLDKFGIDGVRQLLGAGRKDESGDVTEGAGLDKGQIDQVIAYVETGDVDGNEGVAELATIEQLVRAAGYGADRIKIDPSVVRGLEYYTGPVYECELLFDVTNEKGETVQFGSVAGGGRYDGLVKRFTGQQVPATGFSIGVSRLMTALKNLGRLDASHVKPPVLVCVMDRDIQSVTRYQAMVQELRAAGIRSELFQGNPKDFGKQLKYADRRGCAVAVIEGADEHAAGEIQIKDLIEGAKMAAQIESREEWTEARAAQVSVPRDHLVTTVRDVLSRHEG
ncbi:MAG: histidine--tRNA ligase [Rhizobiales bacterium]|nr:histidine--tRNA ligase [Hyphomicrobiales bacterium]